MKLIIKKANRRNTRNKIKQLYTSSFDKNERIPFWMIILMSFTKTTDFFAFYDNENFIGFTYMATLNNIVFIFFLAVDDDVRSKGYGSQILTAIKEKYLNHKIIISINRADYNKKIKLQNFLFKNDFSYTGYLMKSGDKEQDIMIANGDFNKRELQRFFHIYSNASMVPKIWEDDSISK